MALATGNAIVSNAGFVINTTETYLTTNTALVANINTAVSTLGNVYRITLGGLNTTAGEKVGPLKYNLKMGLGGNVADATVCTVTGLRDVGDSNILGAVFYLTVRSNPVSNVINVSAFGFGFNPKDQPNSVGNVTSATGASNLIIGASFAGGDGFSNATFQTAVIEQVA